MKNFLLALAVILTTCTLAIAQNNTVVTQDSIGKIKISVKKSSNANTNNTAMTVIGVDVTDADSTDVNADSCSVSHSSASFTIDDDDFDFPFKNFGNAISGGILLSIIAIIAVFGFPVFILFVIFFFRYKNRKARYRLAEQAIAAGQPLPAEFTGIGLFIFLWAITGDFGIGTIGLLVTFMGIGQWIIGSNQKHNPDTSDTWMHNIGSKDKESDEPNSEEKNKEEKNEEEKEK